MSSDWSLGSPAIFVWFAGDVPSPNSTNTVPPSFVVGSVPRFIRLRTAPSVMPREVAACATVRRSWFACGSLVWPSPTREILDHQDRSRKPLEAILALLDKEKPPARKTGGGVMRDLPLYLAPT